MLNINTKNVTPIDFINKLWELQNTAKTIHLQQVDLSLATHMAMEKLYENLDVDNFTECYMGLYGTFPVKMCNATVNNTEEYVKSVYNYISSNRSIFKESFLQNLIDEFLEELAHTLYRLKYTRALGK